MFLEKWQRNAIFEAIEKADLDARDFDLDVRDDDALLSLRGSESVFIIGRDDPGYRVSKKVGEQALEGYAVTSWSDVEDPPLELWLIRAKQDLETPDLWAELRHEREILRTASADDAENTPFTSDEQAKIAKQLQEIKTYVRKTYALSEAQTEAVEAQLDEIGAAAGRMGRRDWFALVVGTLTILQTVLPPGATRHIFLMLLRAVAQLRGYPFTELPGH